jgi:hypothetical protein
MRVLHIRSGLPIDDVVGYMHPILCNLDSIFIHPIPNPV